MTQIPPNLVYLTIYNPTLKPVGPVDNDDEDAEEQAHILFYTSKERAVSRDRMLRQIGLAKALINYAELFNPSGPCDNVHSQSKRMIMVSPEPGFWIHAGIELAKAPRVIDPKTKSKSKPVDKDKGKQKDPELYDYKDGSVHDGAIRAHILKGYERFKLTHGSFTTILSTLGQQALELQLERFWTVWAWSWDFDQPPDFGEDLGPLVHPCFASLISLLDDFSSHLSSSAAIVLAPSYIVPSTSYTAGQFPASLAFHLWTMIPPKVAISHSSDTLNTLASSVDTIKGKLAHNEGTGTFLGMPTINMKMDMPKWTWPDWTFGKNMGPKQPTSEPSPTPSASKDSKESQDAAADSSDHRSQIEVQVNSEDLEDAMSDTMSTTSSGERKREEPKHVEDDDIVSFQQQDSTQDEEDPEATPVISTTGRIAFLGEPVPPPPPSPPPSPPPLPEFSVTKVHLSSPENPTATKRVPIRYIAQNGLMLALVDTAEENADDSDDNSDLRFAAENVIDLFNTFDSPEYDAASAPESSVTLSKILQTQDRYMISKGQHTYGIPDFKVVSSHLFNAKAILDRDPDMTEVFSRGQNPQHWHIAKRCIGGSPVDAEGGGSDNAVFMEVFRKETSLTDVDNVLAGVVKKSGLSTGIPRSR